VPAFGAAGRASKDGGDDAAADGEGEEAAEGDAVFGGPEIAPVVQLSEVPKQTGEEEEDVLYAGEVGRSVGDLAAQQAEHMAWVATLRPWFGRAV
jgi:hypothetical protein